MSVCDSFMKKNNNHSKSDFPLSLVYAPDSFVRAIDQREHIAHLKEEGSIFGGRELFSVF